MNLLIVDDVRFIRIGMRKLVENEALEVYDAGSYNGAINILKQTKVDILLLDLNLTGCNTVKDNEDTAKSGIDILKYIVAEKIEMPYVIVVSGNLSEEKVIEAYGFNVRRFIPKSSIMDSLQQAVKEAIKERSSK